MFYFVCIPYLIRSLINYHVKYSCSMELLQDYLGLAVTLHNLIFFKNKIEFYY